MVASPGGPAPAAPIENTTHSPETIDEVHLVLEVKRGRTRFRRRPVTAARFLIGAGVTCDLRLGGDAMPPLHSLITRRGAEIRIEAICPQPPLAINGTVIQEARLADGDVISFGNMEFIARIVAGSAPAADAGLPSDAASQNDWEAGLSELSALELVERIEAEERAIENYEARLRTSARALTESVLARAGKSAAVPAKHERAVPAPHFLSKRPQVLVAQGRAQSKDGLSSAAHLDADIEKLGQQLTALSAELKATSERALLRESHFSDATSQLMETQQKLVSQIETLLAQVDLLQQQKASAMASKPRAIA